MQIQLVIIILYLAIIVSVGIMAKKKSVSATSFHGAGFGVLMCVAAGTGEWLGGTSTTGVSEYGFLFGISGAWYTISNGIGIVILAVFFAKLYRSLDTVTVPGIMGHFLGTNARTVASIMLIFVMLIVGVSQVIAAGTLGVAILGLDFNLSVLILGLAFIAYTILGGMTAVGYTNFIHLIVMYGGIILAIIFAFKQIGGYDVMAQSLPAEPYMSVNGAGTSRVFSWLIASVLGACTAQAGIQPLLAAKDAKTAKKAAFITALVVAPFGVLTALLGMVARVQFPNLANAKLALPTLMMSMDPVIGGMVLAAIFAAVLSTISPIILATATLFTKDIYQKLWHPEINEQKLLFVSRLATGISGIICIAAAMIFYGSSRILDMVYFAYTLRGTLFIVLIFGIYWKRTSSKGAIYAIILTGLTGLFWVLFKAVTGNFPIHPQFTETYAAIIVASVATVLFSLIFPKSGDDLENKYIKVG